MLKQGVTYLITQDPPPSLPYLFSFVERDLDSHQWEVDFCVLVLPRYLVVLVVVHPPCSGFPEDDWKSSDVGVVSGPLRPYPPLLPRVTFPFLLVCSLIVEVKSTRPQVRPVELLLVLECFFTRCAATGVSPFYHQSLLTFSLNRLGLLVLFRRSFTV